MMPQTIKGLLETNYIECFDTLKEVAKDDHDARNILYPIEEERLSFINFLNSFKEIFDYSINYYVVLNKDVGENLNYIDGGNGSNRTRLSNNSRLSGLYPNYEGTYFKKVRILSFEQFQERYLEKYFMEILNCN